MVRRPCLALMRCGGLLGKALVPLALIILVSACGAGATTASPTTVIPSPLPTESSLLVVPTDVPPTEVQPTATALPTMTATDVPPTQVLPTATTAPTPSAPPPAAGDAWQETYRVSGSEVVHDLLMAEDGGYYLVGTKDLVFEPEQNGDVYLIRTDPSGKKVWERTYGGDALDEGTTILPTPDGQLMIVGYTASFGAGGLDVYLIKVGHDGTELWSKTFGGPLDEMGVGGQAQDGSMIVGGSIVDPSDIVADPGAAGYAGLAGRSNVFITRADGDGNPVWTQTFGGEQNVLATAAVPAPDGGFVVLASIIAYPEPGNHIYLLKVDENGQEVWARTWEEDDASGYSLAQASDGGYLITGPYLPEGSGKQDFLFIKTDAEGNEVWRSTFGDPNMIDYGAVLTAAADGGYVAAGEWVKDYRAGDSDLVLVKIDAQGQLVWQQKTETNAHHMLARILEHPDGGYVIATSILSGSNFDFDIMLLKTSIPASPTEATGPVAGAISVETAGQVELLHTLEGHDDRVSGLAFSPDGRYLGSSSLDGVVQLWDPASWQVIQKYTASNAFGWRLFFLADGAHISSGNGTVWDIATGERVHALRGDHRVTFSPDGAWMAVAGREQLDVQLWRVEGWQLEWEAVDDQLGYIFTLAFSPDSRLLASSYNVYPNDRQHTIKLWNVANGEQVFTLGEHQGDIHTLAFSPDGKILASASADGTVRLWDVETGTWLRTLSNGSVVFDEAFSPDGTLLAVAGEGAVNLWDVASGHQVRSLPLSDVLMAVAFSPDGTLLAAGGYERQIHLWGVPR